MTYYVTADSFGEELPRNWEEIAEYLNNLIDERGISENNAECNELWDEYWKGNISGAPAAVTIWYAVQRDPQDDWGTGSRNLEEAKEMAREQLDEYPDTLIAVIDDSGSNPVCIDEIRDF